MATAGEILLGVLREAWDVLVIVTIALAILALLSQVLRSAAGNLLGANPITAQAITSGAGLLLLVLFGFLGIPAMVKSIHITAPSCGPISELGQLAATLIGAFVAFRMLRSVFVAVATTAAGAPNAISNALLEIGGAVLGMLVAVVAVPVATAFFGAC
jgi:hypothetical protein